jgi:hypothetical protein
VVVTTTMFARAQRIQDHESAIAASASRRRRATSNRRNSRNNARTSELNRAAQWWTGIMSWCRDRLTSRFRGSRQTNSISDPTRTTTPSGVTEETDSPSSSDSEVDRPPS